MRKPYVCTLLTLTGQGLISLRTHHPHKQLEIILFLLKIMNELKKKKLLNMENSSISKKFHPSA